MFREGFDEYMMMKSLQVLVNSYMCVFVKLLAFHEK